MHALRVATCVRTHSTTRGPTQARVLVSLNARAMCIPVPSGTHEHHGRRRRRPKASMAAAW